MHLCCITCEEHIWIGQNDSFYSGMPEVMEALRLFLIKHKTTTTKNNADNNTDWQYHELIYEPEPFNGGHEELSGRDWKEWDADYYKK
jgi:hypothetical protein